MKVQRFIKGEGEKPQSDYVGFVQRKMAEYQSDCGKVWKEYIMFKFGLTSEKQENSRKRVKLDSLKD